MITENEILTQEVRALNWKQPFAALMLHGKQETRKWKTDYRGLVLLCASFADFTEFKLKDKTGNLQRTRIDQALGNRWRSKPLPRGAAFAIGRLTHCLPMAEHEESLCFVKFSHSLWVHHYDDVTPINPIGWKGSQGWRRLTDDEKRLIVLTPSVSNIHQTIKQSR